MTAHKKEIEGYKFVGWKRGADTSDANAWVDITGNSYNVWTNTYLTAIYEPITESGKKVVEFWNQNGAYLGQATESNYTAIIQRKPTLTGYGEFIGWFTDGNVELTADTVLHPGTTNAVAQYEEGAVSDVKREGEVVIEADVYDEKISFTKSIDGFTCWKRDGEIVSYDDTYNYFVWGPTDITEGNDEIECKVPVGILEYNEDYGAYLFEYDAGECEIAEAGIIFGGESIDSCTKKYTSQRKVLHNQFTVPEEGNIPARGYIIYRLNDGSVYEVKYFSVAE